MIKYILFFILISISNTSFSQKIFIVSSERNHKTISYYVNKLPSNYIIKGLIKTSKTTNINDISDKIIEFNPEIIIFIGDFIIKNYLITHITDYNNAALFYCCNFNEYSELQNISGIDYKINYEKLQHIILKFDNIYILKSDTIDSEIISDLFYYFINKFKPVQLQNIDSMYSLRKFFIKVNKSSLVFNFVSTLDNTYDRQMIADEIKLWNKKSIVIDFYTNGIISLIPNYDDMGQRILEYTLSKKYLKYQNILDLEFNYQDIPLNKQDYYFKFNLDIFKNININ